MPILGLNQPKKSASELAKERAAKIMEFASQVRCAKFLDTQMYNDGINQYVIYCFMAEFEDGHRELCSGKEDNDWIRAILPKVDW